MAHPGRALGAGCRAPGGLGAPGRRAGPALQGPACHTRGLGKFAQAQLHGRRLSRPALVLLGPGRSGAEDPQGCCSEHVWHDRTSRRGAVPPLRPKRRQPLRARGRERRPRERRSGGPGSGAAAGSAANEARFPARSGQRVPEAERSSTRPQGRDRRKAVHGAHHSGCVSTRRWASARMRARPCTLTGPRWSSERWMT